MPGGEVRCYNCGTDNAEKLKFCAVCGYRLEERRFRDWMRWSTLSPDEKKVVKRFIGVCGILFVAMIIALIIAFPV